jgi:hypothetical protein
MAVRSITGLRLSRRAAAVDSGCEVVLSYIDGRSFELWQIEWNVYLSTRRDSLYWQGRRRAPGQAWTRAAGCSSRRERSS